MTQYRVAAALALAAAFMAADGAAAQSGPNPYVIPRPPGAFNPATVRQNLAVAPGAFRPSFGGCASGPSAAMGPCSGPVYSTITVQRTGGNAGFGMLIFEAMQKVRTRRVHAATTEPARGLR